VGKRRMHRKQWRGHRNLAQQTWLAGIAEANNAYTQLDAPPQLRLRHETSALLREGLARGTEVKPCRLPLR